MLARKKIKIFLKAAAIAITALLFFGSVFASGLFYEKSYSERIYPGVMVGAFSMGGLSYEEAEKTLSSQVESLRQSGLVFEFKDQKVIIPMSMISTGDPDLAYDIIKYNIPKTLSLAFEHGRRGQGALQWAQRLSGIFVRRQIDPVFEFDSHAAMAILEENLSSIEHPSKPAKLVIQNGSASILEEKSGIIFDYEKSLDSAREQLEDIIFETIELSIKRDDPEITIENSAFLLDQAQNAIYKKGVRITYEGMSWYWPASVINDFIELKKDQKTSRIYLGVSDKKIKELLEPIKSKINIEMREARFLIEEGRVKEFQQGSGGKKINEEETIKKWEQAMFGSENHPEELDIIVEEVLPSQDLGDLNDLGISERLGVGFTNFAGSPANRRHNIKNGSDTLNGMIIEPGEEFSLVKALGNIDAASGYKTELVIKGNKTVPEYGGGLCQIGTTIFRAALSSGLPITERRPHSYTVSYYFDEKGKPGKDATIYIPHPDLRFINDTGSYILILNRIEGDNLFFEFWGTKDGRIIEQTDVAVWDRVSPPSTKYVETLSLKPGERKCTEYPHAGMKASFDYIVTYPNGEKKEENFFSQYFPWQEVCLVGVEKLLEESNDEGLERGSVSGE